MAGNVLIKNANGNTVTLQNPDTNLADVVVDTSKIASKQYVDDADALKVALSSFTGTNQSLVSNGYQKLPGGLIIQWGTQTPPANAIVQTYNFPISFQTNCLTFVASLGMGGNGGTSKNDGTGGKYISASQYQMVNCTGGSAIKIDWIAIGY